MADVEHAAMCDSQVGESRATATNAARSAMRVYRASIAIGPGAPDLWITLIAPGADLAAAQGARLLIVTQDCDLAHERADPHSLF